MSLFPCSCFARPNVWCWRVESCGEWRANNYFQSKLFLRPRIPPLPIQQCFAIVVAIAAVSMCWLPLSCRALGFCARPSRPPFVRVGSFSLLILHFVVCLYTKSLFLSPANSFAVFFFPLPLLRVCSAARC